MITIAPAVAIVISVITLAKDLGIALPWLRLSVVGSLSYETIAAANAESAMGLVFGQVTSLTGSQYVTIAAVMTLSILVGIWLVPVLCKRMQKGMISLEKRDKKWSEIFQSAMFIGMIAAFVGYVFCDVSTVFHGSAAGLIPVCVMAVSALVMCLSGVLVKVTKARWISDYALPVSLTLPLTEEEHTSPTLFSFFDGIIPEGWLLDVASRNWKLDKRDRFGLLMVCCRDCIGDVSVREVQHEV